MKKFIIPILSIAVVASSCNDATKDGSNASGSADSTTQASTPIAGNSADVKADEGPFQIEPLKYGYADLEKLIDPKTMEIH